MALVDVATEHDTDAGAISGNSLCCDWNRLCDLVCRGIRPAPNNQRGESATKQRDDFLRDICAICAGSSCRRVARAAYRMAARKRMMHDPTVHSAPNRRWPRFSLRTMFVVLTVFCCWLGWNVYRVREHNRIAVLLLHANGTHGTNIVAAWSAGDEEFKLDARSRLPYLWRMLGALPVDSINLVSLQFTESDAKYYEQLFPEPHVALTRSNDGQLSTKH
jgi:hypothetical protein